MSMCGLGSVPRADPFMLVTVLHDKAGLRLCWCDRCLSERRVCAAAVGSADKTDLGGVGGQAQDSAPGVAAPPRSHETAEGRHKVHPCTDTRRVSHGRHITAAAWRQTCFTMLQTQHELTQATSAPKQRTAHPANTVLRPLTCVSHIVRQHHM